MGWHRGKNVFAQLKMKLFSFGVVLALLLPAGLLYAQTATIGGNIFTGQQINGLPDYTSAPLLYDASVMVQKQEGGEFVVYGNVTGNSWTATVPAPGDYVVMFSAKDHEPTSREFTITIDYETQSKDAYLPPLPLPLANLLVYTFYDNYVNGEWDDGFDAPLNGVTVKAWDKDGNLLATGISGTQAGQPDGHYYFTNLPPGEVFVTSDPSTAHLYDLNGPNPLPVTNPVTRNPLDFNETTEFYLLTTEEGGSAFEVVLYPGDPGTEAGAYMVWHGYTEKLGQMGDRTNPTPFNPNIAGSINGALLDADQVAIFIPDPTGFPDPPLSPLHNPGVSANTIVPKGLVILSVDSETMMPHAVATAETDPLTGEFSFKNVPPGRYKLFCADRAMDYVFVQRGVSVTPQQVSWILPGVLVPRFFGRIQGYVKEESAPVVGAEVHLRLKDGSIWKTESSDAAGWYSFDDVPEVEVLGYVDVALPEGYRGAWKQETFYPVAGNPGITHQAGFNGINRYVQWYTANYRADLFIEKIPATEGHLDGFVFLDELKKPLWSADGIYDPKNERTLHGIVLNLWKTSDCSSDPLTGKYSRCNGTPARTTSTGAFNKQELLAQGWHEPYTLPPDEWGGVYVGKLPGYYEFRNLLPGDYILELLKGDVNATGYLWPPGQSNFIPVSVGGGQGSKRDLGLQTLAPMAAEIEGGVFDDLFIDPRPLSLLAMEKAGIDGVPVGAYDHLGYFLGAGHMGNPMCYSGAAVGTDRFFQCPPDQPLGQKPEMGRRFAPSALLYLANDPLLPGYNPDYLPLIMTYTMGQGQYKFEADWSLLPIAFSAGGMQQLFPDFAGQLPLTPQPPAAPAAAPVIRNVVAAAGFTITGAGFGAQRGFSTVSLSGQELPVISWSATEIKVDIPPDAISGPLIVTTLAGPSTAFHVDIPNNATQTSYLAQHAVYVDAGNTGAEDGSQQNPWSSINKALQHLPTATPRYLFVAAGYYNERIQIVESDIRIIGAGPRETVVNGLGAVQRSMENQNTTDRGPVFFIGRGGQSGSVKNIMISGLTITGGSIDEDIGAGIFGDYGNRNIDINNCILDHNGGYYGGAIWLHKTNHDVRIWSNTISFNGNIGGYGGGISVNDEPEYGPSHGEPEHVVDDEIPGCPPGTYEIFNNHLFNNFSPDYGGAIALYEVKDHLIVAGNLIENNHADDHGGGVFFEDSGPIDLYGNIIRRNSNFDDGGAISFEDVTDHNAIVRVYNNLIAENWSDDHGENHARGAALAFDDTLYAEVINNTIVNNIVAGSRDPVGGAISSERHGHEYNGMEALGRNYAPGFSDVKLTNNIIWGNKRLKYDQRPHADEEDLDWRFGINHVWTLDNIHVDDPYAQPESLAHLNSEAFSVVEYNNIDNGEYAGRSGAISVDPQFVDPDHQDWHLKPTSPASKMGAYANLASLPASVGTVSPLAARTPLCNTTCFGINEVTIGSNGTDVSVRGTFGGQWPFNPTTDSLNLAIQDGSGYTANDSALELSGMTAGQQGSIGKSSKGKSSKEKSSKEKSSKDDFSQLGAFSISTSRLPKISRPIGTQMMISLGVGNLLGREGITLKKVNGQLTYQRQPQLNCTPVQPIQFDHKDHVAERKISLNCQFCHTSGTAQDKVGLPTKYVCFSCHVDGNKRRVKAFNPYIGNSTEIPWVPMAVLRPGVSFSHSRHVTDGKIECISCHADQASLSKPRTVVYRVMTMAQCRNCHHDSGVRNDCGACHKYDFPKGYIAGE